MSVYHQRLQRRRLRGAVGCTPVPRRCRGLTESVTAHAVSWHRDQSSGVCPLTRSSLRHHPEQGYRDRSRGQVGGIVTRAAVLVRSADPFSVNPGRSPGMGKGAACTAGRCRCGMGVYHQRRRSRGAVGCTPVPRRCRGLTEIVTAHAVKSAASSRAGVLFRSCGQ